MHHLVPRADGGKDSFDNAVALCFDCHMYAGQAYYSTKHPRGTKYTLSEIKKARQALYQDVGAGRVSTPSDQPFPLSVRFLLVRDFEIALEIAAGKSTSLPFDPPILTMPNEVSRYYRQLTSKGDTWRRERIALGQWPSVAEYRQEHPDSERTTASQSEGCLPYYEYVRACTPADVEKARTDPLTEYLLDAGCCPEDLISIVGWTEQCGPGVFLEDLRLREVIPVCLCLTNDSDGPVNLSTLDGFSDDAPIPPRSVQESYVRPTSLFRLPGGAIAPGATVVIPAATLVAPFETSCNLFSVRTHGTTVERGPFPLQVGVQLAETVGFLPGHALVGPSVLPSRVEFEVLGTPRAMPVHALDPERVYTLDASFQMGSCPFLFAQYFDGWRYIGEVCVDNDSRLGQITYLLDSASAIAIIELEDEYALVDSVCLDGQEALRAPLWLVPERLGCARRR